MYLNYDELIERSAEVEAFMRLYGFDLHYACELAGIEPHQYQHTERQLAYIPSPEKIQEEVDRIHSGELVIHSAAEFRVSSRAEGFK